MSKKVINYVFISSLLLFFSYLVWFSNKNVFSIYTKIMLFVLTIICFFLFILFRRLNKVVLTKLFSTKEKGILVYILIQIMQVIFLPIPAAIICIVGSIIYGPLLGAVYCSIGILIGSYISFFIGKTFGYKLVSWIVGKDNTEKYTKIIRKRGGFFLAIAFLLPMFPDDILCLISGITNLSFKQFFWITLITRPIGVIAMSYFGGGHIIPFSGWGIYAWMAILICVVTIIVITYKYQDNMQTFILNKIFKKHKH